VAMITFLSNDAKVVVAPDNSNLLRVSLREKGGIPFKCGAGLCGTCRCLIEQGIENTDAVKAKERNHLSPDDLARGYRMACQTFVLGDVSVSWVPLALRVPARVSAAPLPPPGPSEPSPTSEPSPPSLP